MSDTVKILGADGQYHEIEAGLFIFEASVPASESARVETFMEKGMKVNLICEGKIYPAEVTAIRWQKGKTAPMVTFRSRNYGESLAALGARRYVAGERIHAGSYVRVGSQGTAVLFRNGEDDWRMCIGMSLRDTEVGDVVTIVS